MQKLYSIEGECQAYQVICYPVLCARLLALVIAVLYCSFYDNYNNYQYTIMMKYNSMTQFYKNKHLINIVNNLQGFSSQKLDTLGDLCNKNILTFLF